MMDSLVVEGDGQQKEQSRSSRSAVIVLGMHRSGTSALARVLNLLGCDLPKNLMAANPTNEAGHWEPQLIAALNDRILESGGSSWDDWLRFNPRWLDSPKAEEFCEEAVELTRSEFGGSRLFVLKDPRICRLLPFWQRVLQRLDAQPLVIMPLRNPLEVAESLERRNGFDPAMGHLLWLRNVLDAEAASRGLPRVFTSFDGLMGGWVRVLEDAQAQFGISWPRLSERAAGEIDAFLSEGYRHHREPAEKVIGNPILSAWLRDSFEILNGWAEAGERHQDFATLDRIREGFDAAAPAFSRLIASGRQSAIKVRQLEGALNEERTKLGQAEAELGALRDRLASTESALAQRRLEAEQAGTELDAARAAHAEELERLLAAHAAALDGVRAELDKARAVHAAELAGVRAELDKARAAHAAELAGVRQELDTAQAAKAAELKQAAADRAAVEKRLRDRFDEIATLTRLVGDAERTADAKAAEAAELRGAAAREVGQTVLALLADGGWRALPARVRMRRQKALLKRSGLFDADWYRRRYPDVARDGMDPAQHYILFGASEGREPNGALNGEPVPRRS